jgi:hypothetical protein
MPALIRPPGLHGRKSFTLRRFPLLPSLDGRAIFNAMMSSLLPFGEAGPSFGDLAAISALLLSAAALWACLRYAHHARRNADQAIGDLPPNLSLYPAPRGLGSKGMEDLMLRIDNYNRRPIRVTGVRLERPAKTGLVAYVVESSRETLCGGGERAHNEVPMNLTVAGTPPGAGQFSSANIKLVLAGEAPKTRKGKPLPIAVRVSFEILQATPEKRSELVSLEFVPSPVPVRRPATIPQAQLAG